MKKLRVLFFLCLLLFSSLYVQATDIKSGLKEVGISTLPTFLDATTNNITIKMPKILGGQKLTFGGTIDAEALQEKKFVFETSDEHKLTWNDAFGMTFLDLSEVALNLSIEKGAFSISLDGMLGGAFSKNNKKTAVIIELEVEDKKLKDFTLSLPNTKLNLHNLGELKNLPGVSKFAIESPTISMHAIYGKIDFLNETVDSVVFYDEEKKDWNIGLQFEKALTLATLTGHKGSFLDHLGLPKMKMLVSTKGIKQPYEELPFAAQDFFLEDGSLPEGDLELEDGVNIVASFDPSLASSDLKSALKTLGLGSTVLEIDGTIEGMFGGEPAVELNVDIDAPKSHSFKFLKMKHAQAEFFIKLSKEEAALGFSTKVTMKQGNNKPDLEFDVDFEFAKQETEAEVMVSGAMVGDWENAAGIKGLILENPFMSVGINESGSFDMLIDGTILIGHEKVRAAADLVLSPEALGLPTAFAFAGEINKIKLDTLSEHAKKHTKLKNGGFKNMSAEFKDVAFAYMTPGAHLPEDLENELSIEGAGMALKATLLINNKELGTANGYFSTEGIKINGSLSPFKLGPLDLKDAQLDIQAGENISPAFKMSGDIELFKGFEEKYSIDLEPATFKFYSDSKFGGAFEAIINAESEGLNFNPSNDFSFDAQLDAKYTKLFKELTQAALKGMKQEDNAIKNAKDKVAVAENKVSQLNEQIKKAREKAQEAYDKASKSIDDAKDKVDKLQNTINDNKKKAHDLHDKAKNDAKHLKLAKATEDKTEEAAVYAAIKTEEAALKTAKWALDNAKKATNIVPVDIAPKVVELKAELLTEEAALKTAQGFLNDMLKVNNGIESAIKEIDKGLSVVKINKIGVSGSIKGIITLGKEGEEPKLLVDAEIFQKQHVFHEPLILGEKEFKKLAKSLANDVAKEIIKEIKK